MVDDRIVAVGLLTETDLRLLGHSFHRLWPVDEAPCFDELLRAIDRADGQLQRTGGGSARAPTAGQR